MEENYFGSIERQKPEISPLLGTFDNLPSILVHAAELDVYFSDAIQFFEKVNKGSMKVELNVFKRLWHNFHMMDAMPEAKRALTKLSSFVDRNF